MLCSVLALSLPAIQLLAKSDDPNGLVPPKNVRCGIDPALSRDNRAALLDACALALACSSLGGVPAPYGLFDAEGLPDLGRSDGCEVLISPLTGGNREGTVPALVRLAELSVGAVAAAPAVAWPASKSGKLSLPGDSGMVSRSGVEWPLPVVGGPHNCGVRPSCAWISRALTNR